VVGFDIRDEEASDFTIAEIVTEFSIPAPVPKYETFVLRTVMPRFTVGRL
jgi:hypothetical protein